MFRSYLPLSLFVLMAVGCGESGPTLYHLQGEVTFDGKPVPFGRVEFEPDTTKGNSGGMGYAPIKDGKYDTQSEAGRGVAGGPHVVRFTGLESDPMLSNDETTTSNAPPPVYLFVNYSQQHDLPKEDGTLDFTVPPEAKSTLNAAPSAPRGNVP